MVINCNLRITSLLVLVWMVLNRLALSSLTTCLLRVGGFRTRSGHSLSRVRRFEACRQLWLLPACPALFHTGSSSNQPMTVYPCCTSGSRCHCCFPSQLGKGLCCCRSTSAETGWHHPAASSLTTFQNAGSGTHAISDCSLNPAPQSAACCQSAPPRAW